ncbi:hypothetical protein [Pseudomonas sp. S3E12]|uniref:hypothetical protein n=1 Tax=Pseudomonas sp. S3E12 TaxID=1873126 RepID=UPI00114CE449|nr:hypothetical protein [Pseudomonas sp. S3E12]
MAEQYHGLIPAGTADRSVGSIIPLPSSNILPATLRAAATENFSQAGVSLHALSSFLMDLPYPIIDTLLLTRSATGL